MFLYLIFILVAIDLEKVDEDWTKSSGPYQIKDIANHYGIYEHLFGDAYFIPRVFLTIKVFIRTIEIR